MRQHVQLRREEEDVLVVTTAAGDAYYYELTIVKLPSGSQFGFATPAFKHGEGIGPPPSAHADAG